MALLTQRHKAKDRERAFQEYFLFGKQVCQKTFCFVHGIGVNTLRRKGSHLDNHELSEKVHGNKARVLTML